jgi:hypothetical protein
VAIVKGFHQGQEKRRCLLLETTYGLSDD